MNDLILRNTLVLPAIFLHSLSHCTSHERLSSRWIPQYIIEFTCSTETSLMVTFTWFCTCEFFPDQHHGRFICIYPKTITGIPRNSRIKSSSVVNESLLHVHWTRNNIWLHHQQKYCNCHFGHIVGNNLHIVETITALVLSLVVLPCPRLICYVVHTHTLTPTV